MVKNTKSKVLSVTIRVFTFSGGWLFGTIAGDNSSMKYKKVKGSKMGYKMSGEWLILALYQAKNMKKNENFWLL